MPEAQSSGERMDPVYVLCLALPHVVHDFNNPVIVDISDGRVSVARYFVAELGNWRRNNMRVEVSHSRRMLKTNHVTVLEVP